MARHSSYGDVIPAGDAFKNIFNSINNSGKEADTQMSLQNSGCTEPILNQNEDRCVMCTRGERTREQTCSREQVIFFRAQHKDWFSFAPINHHMNFALHRSNYYHLSHSLT